MPEMTIGAMISHWPKIPPIDLELIIAHAINKDRTFVIAHPEWLISAKNVSTIMDHCTQRFTGYPLAYIIGKKEFYGRDFIVNSSTLIPRPETEMIIPLVSSILGSTRSTVPTLLMDIGTGSGIIAITIALECASHNIAPIIATDISHDALVVARKNALIHTVEKIITFIESDLLSDLLIQEHIKRSHCDNIVICANLPYVDHAKKGSLITQPESQALCYEPDVALWSDDRGLAHYITLLTQIMNMKDKFPHKSIYCLLEIDPDQKDELNNILLHRFLARSVKFFDDLSSRTRYVQCVF